MRLNRVLLGKLKGCGGIPEIIATAEQNGYDLTEEQAEAYLAKLNVSDEKPSVELPTDEASSSEIDEAIEEIANAVANLDDEPAEEVSSTEIDDAINEIANAVAMLDDDTPDEEQPQTIVQTDSKADLKRKIAIGAGALAGVAVLTMLFRKKKK